MTETKYFHALQILADNCTGCTACVRVCPTEAIRVRDHKANIDPYRCVDCGNCVNVCRFHAIIPLAIVIGNEALGIESSILELCDEFITLPQLGWKNSLNVGVATGIVLYQILFGGFNG